MDIYYSLWNLKKMSKGYLDLARKSFFSFYENYKDIYLVTDSDCKTLNPEILDLPWKNVFIGLDELDKEYRATWSLGKIKAYQIAARNGRQFFHVDFDVFIKGTFLERILDAGVIIQSVHTQSTRRWGTNNYHNPAFVPFQFLPREIQWDRNYNCGFVGGNDLDFIDFYSEVALKTVTNKHNKKYWQVDPSRFRKACIAEQYILALVEKHKKKNIEFVLDHGSWQKMVDDWKNNSNSSFKYLHLWGKNKNTHSYLADL